MASKIRIVRLPSSLDDGMDTIGMFQPGNVDITDDAIALYGPKAIVECLNFLKRRAQERYGLARAHRFVFDHDRNGPQLLIVDGHDRIEISIFNASNIIGEG